MQEKLNYLRTKVATHKLFFIAWLGVIVLLCCSLTAVVGAIGLAGQNNSEVNKYEACNTLSSNSGVTKCKVCIDAGNDWDSRLGCITKRSTGTKTSGRFITDLPVEPDKYYLDY